MLQIRAFLFSESLLLNIINYWREAALRGRCDLGLGGSLQVRQFLKKTDSLALSASNLPSSWENIFLLPKGGYGWHSTAPMQSQCAAMRKHRDDDISKFYIVLF